MCAARDRLTSVICAQSHPATAGPLLTTVVVDISTTRLFKAQRHRRMETYDPAEDVWLSQHEHVGFFGSVLGGAYLLLALPAWLWRLYVEYLWNWDAHPWVKNAAATFRLVAILVIAPFALLTLLVSTSFIHPLLFFLPLLADSMWATRGD